MNGILRSRAALRAAAKDGTNPSANKQKDAEARGFAGVSKNNPVNPAQENTADETPKETPKETQEETPEETTEEALERGFTILKFEKIGDIDSRSPVPNLFKINEVKFINNKKSDENHPCQHNINETLTFKVNDIIIANSDRKDGMCLPKPLSKGIIFEINGETDVENRISGLNEQLKKATGEEEKTKIDKQINLQIAKRNNINQYFSRIEIVARTGVNIKKVVKISDPFHAQLELYDGAIKKLSDKIVEYAKDHPDNPDMQNNMKETYSTLTDDDKIASLEKELQPNPHGGKLKKTSKRKLYQKRRTLKYRRNKKRKSKIRRSSKR